MFDLKVLSPEAIDRSLEKAVRYRLLSEADAAESICLDVLAVAHNHQVALATLLLALTDQFANEPDSVRRAQEVLPRLEGEYERAYYAGIISERRASARLLGRVAGSDAVAYELYHKAMEAYERAETLSPHGNDDARLRWNTCARQIMRHKLTPAGDEGRELLMLE
jgi:hypothetical protein